MNAEHEEAVEFAKVSKRENRVYVGNLSYDVKYRDLMEFMRGGGWGTSPISVFRIIPQRERERPLLVLFFVVSFLLVYLPQRSGEGGGEGGAERVKGGDGVLCLSFLFSLENFGTRC